MTHETMTCDTFTELLGATMEGDLDPSQVAAVEAHAAGCAGCAALRSDLERISAEASQLPVLSPSRDLWQGIAERIDAKVLPMVAPSAASGGAHVVRRPWLRQALMAAGLVLVTASVTWFAARQVNEGPVSRQVAGTERATIPVQVPVQAVDSSAPATGSGDAATEVAADNRGGTRPAVTTPTSEFTRGSSSRATVAEGPRPVTRPNPTGERAPTAQLASATEMPQAAREVEAVYGSEIQRLHDIMAQRKSELDPATVKVIEDNLAIIDSAIVQSRRAIARDPNSGFLMEQLNSVLDRKVGLLRTAAMLPARS